MSRIPIFIPYVNRPDLLDKAIRSTWHSGAEAFVFDNSDGGELPDSASVVITPPVPLTFAQTQNDMLRRAIGPDVMRGVSTHISHPFYLFMHSDAEAGEGTIQKLIEMAYALTKEGRKWGAIFTAYDALAAFNTEAMKAIGGWETLFPWYFSDNVTYRKMRLAGYEILESNLPVKHEPSQTIKSDPHLNFLNSLTFPFYEQLYTRMWGGSPGRETFQTPFNR